MFQLIVVTIFLAFLVSFCRKLRRRIRRLFRPIRKPNRNIITTSTTDGTMSIICTICQDFLTERPEGLASANEIELVATRCGHLYHTFCIQNWFNSHGRHECPVCKSPIRETEFLSIYPSGDEHSGEVSERLKKASADCEENVILKGELNQYSMILEETGQTLQEEKQAHDELKYDFAQRLSEIDELRRQCEENLKLKESSERNWMELMDKTSHERDEALKKIDELNEKRISQTSTLAIQKEKVVELCNINMQLQVQNDTYFKEIEDLKAKLSKLVVGDGASFCQKKLETVDIGSQTEDKDLLTLRSRWLMFKTCMKHMENELLLLEDECLDVENRQSYINDGSESDSFKSLLSPSDPVSDCKKEIEVIMGSHQDFEDRTVDDSDEIEEKSVLPMEEFVSMIVDPVGIDV